MNTCRKITIPKKMIAGIRDNILCGEIDYIMKSLSQIIFPLVRSCNYIYAISEYLPTITIPKKMMMERCLVKQAIIMIN